MTDHTDELAGDVRDAWRNIDYATPDVRGTCIAPTAALETIFHDHMRIARENAEYHEKLGDALGRETRERLRAERAEAELAALKRMVTEAATVHVDDGDAIETLRELGYYKGQCFALLPVGELVTEQNR